MSCNFDYMFNAKIYCGVKVYENSSPCKYQFYKLNKQRDVSLR